MLIRHRNPHRVREYREILGVTARKLKFWHRSFLVRQEFVGRSHSHPALAGWRAKGTYTLNRFNGFGACSKPLKRLVQQVSLTATQLKQGVNEKERLCSDLPYKFLAHCSFQM